MGDDESRREDARVEVMIDRALRNGTWGICVICGDPTPHQEPEEVAQHYSPRWICKPCERMMDAPGD